jgi:hypothetical protein
MNGLHAQHKHARCHGAHCVAATTHLAEIAAHVEISIVEAAERDVKAVHKNETYVTVP